MGDKSEIQWTDATWNPVTGCSKVSPGCAHCYAESLTARYAGGPGWIEEHRPWTPANAAHNVRLRLDRLDQPLRWRKPRMVFVNSMSDLFHERVPFPFIAAVFGVMAASPQHIFQVLTKRPKRMLAWFRWRDAEIKARDLAWEPWRLCEDAAWEEVPDLLAGGCEAGWPLRNVWLGVSIENRRYVDRADLLRETPAAVRFISAEPLLGPLVAHFEPDGELGEYVWPDGKVDMDAGPGLNLTGIDWLIAGGESGPSARRMDPQWVRDLRDACRGAGTAFFMKQMSGRFPGGALDALPEDLRIREMPRA